MGGPAIIKVGDKYQYVDSYEIAEAQIPQNEAGYDPLGASNSQGCANCAWFLPPSRCVVVAGDISPTGNSNFWRARVATPVAGVAETRTSATASPFPVDALDDSTSRESVGLLSGLRDLVSKFSLDGRRGASSLRPVRTGTPFPNGKGASASSGADGGGFRLLRQKDGRTRFYTAWSNNFMDREGEIFTAAAHKEFVDWATETGEYPELWLWHTKGSKFGQVDWLDNTGDGFVHASGLIDSGKEAIAEKLVVEASGVSHGFFGLQQANLIHWYRSYELSVLPLKNAAVWTTSFNILNGKAIEMGFTPERRKFFQNLGIEEDQIKSWESQTDGLADALKNIGLESKAAELGVAVEPPPSPEVVAEQSFRVEMLKSMQAQQEVLTALAGQVKAIDDRTKDIKSGDAVIAAAMAPAGGAPGGAVQASKSDDNVVTGPNGQLPNATKEFFEKTILGSLLGAPAQAQ